MRLPLLGFLLALPFFAGALGMLDDFESDVEFLDKSYSDLKKNGVKSKFRVFSSPPTSSASRKSGFRS